VGGGNIGSALMKYKGLEKEGIKISACFDTDPAKFNKKEGNIPILPLEELNNFVKNHKIKMGILAVPDAAAQQVLDMMLSAGIKGVLNFAPIRLRAEGDCVVNNVNLVLELETVIYFIINGMGKAFQEINEDEKP
ncbi:MAG TPA: redox-sensing transcriptional repressor Rex, partial [Candidatus Omnitrophota bacterium]|nr:redox-sensing transcriptional repressor Rex [Candidatus Omnitrophota bacterium]